MKTFKWNIGISIIRIGYLIRNADVKPVKHKRWDIGANILRIGYKLRGEIPKKTWKGNHI